VESTVHLKTASENPKLKPQPRHSYSWSIFVPLLFLMYFAFVPTNLAIPQIGLYFDMLVVSGIFTMFTVLWLCCSPARSACRRGTKSGLFFDLVPVQFECFMIFVQYHLIAAAVFTALLAAALIFTWRRTMSRWEDDLPEDSGMDEETLERSRKKAVNRFHRRAVRISFYLTAVPCFCAIFLYGMQSPTFQALDQVFQKVILSETETETPQIGADPYQENLDLLLHFQKNSWKALSRTERVSTIQLLCNFEADRLGIPHFPLTVVSLDNGSGTLGEYNDEKREMNIDLKLVSEDDPEPVVECISHETYHAMQHFLIRNVDWDSDTAKTAYFQEIRDWKDNTGFYREAWVDGYDAYANQPLEKAASTYSKTETGKIMSCIGTVGEETEAG